jgi:hypothetical protein
VSNGDATPTEAVFVVGVHRSGTTLMRRILDSSSEVAVSGENHYLGHVLARQGVHYAVSRMGDLRDDRVIEKVVAHIYDRLLTRGWWFRVPSRHWIWLMRNVPREEFRQRLLDSDRTERVVFEALLKSYADRRRKRIMGEKTPAHVRFSDKLLTWFPRGRVIHMMRDPRAIYISDVRRRRLQPGSLPFRALAKLPPLLAVVLLVQTTILWQESVLHMKRNRARFGDRYLVVRFEDLVSSPRTEIERICRLLGVEFEEQMLDRVVVSHGQALGTLGFDAQAATRWRRQLRPSTAKWFDLWLGRSMRAIGYS